MEEEQDRGGVYSVCGEEGGVTTNRVRAFSTVSSILAISY